MRTGRDYRTKLKIMVSPMSVFQILSKGRRQRQKTRTVRDTRRWRGSDLSNKTKALETDISGQRAEQKLRKLVSMETSLACLRLQLPFCQHRRDL